MAAPWEQYQQPAAGPWTKYQAVAAPAPKAEYDVVGAPIGVRYAVGTARPQDALPTLQQWYPDAKQTDNGNYVYTDEQGQRVLYNPPGIDMGDVASVARQGIEGAGAMLGGAVGSTLGPAGTLGGAGLGTALASKGMDISRSLMGWPQSYSPMDTVTDTAVGTSGEAAAGIVNKGLQTAANSFIRPGAEKLLDIARRQGLPVSGTLVGRGPYAGTEQLAANVLPLSRPSRTLPAAEDMAANRVSQLAPQPTAMPLNRNEAAQFAGDALKNAADRSYKKYLGMLGNADRSFKQSLPPNTSFALPNFLQKVTELNNALRASPGVGGTDFAPAEMVAKNILKDLQANGGKLPVDLALQARTYLGRGGNWDATTNIPEPSQKFIKDMYAALRKDIYSTVGNNPRALQWLTRRDTLVQATRGEDLGRESVANSLNKILESNSDEAAFAALNSSSGGANRIEQVMRNATPEERRIIARGAWERMMETGAGNQNVSAWASKWLALPSENKRLLFDRVTDVNALDDVAKYIRGMAEGKGFRNSSRTAYDMTNAANVGKITMGLGGLIVGNQIAPGVTAQAAAGAGLAYLLAEAVYSPAAVRALVKIAEGRPATGLLSGPLEALAGSAERTALQAPARNGLLAGPR